MLVIDDLNIFRVRKWRGEIVPKCQPTQERCERFRVITHGRTLHMLHGSRSVTTYPVYHSYVVCVTVVHRARDIQYDHVL